MYLLAPSQGVAAPQGGKKIVWGSTLARFRLKVFIIASKYL